LTAGVAVMAAAYGCPASAGPKPAYSGTANGFAGSGDLARL
jgi:hypothetical protein